MTGKTDSDSPEVEPPETSSQGETPNQAQAAGDNPQAVGEIEAEELAIEVDTSGLEGEGWKPQAQGPSPTSMIDAVEPAGEIGVEAVATLTGPEGRIAELEARVAELEEESKANYDRFLRASADLDNFRKRTRRDLDDARVDARSRALREVLPVIDNLERALEHADKSADEGIVKGVGLVLRQFEQALERCDVTAVDAMAKPFDPNFHEAISQIESTDLPSGSIAQVIQRGYMIGDRLLRPALVVVTRAPAPPVEVAEPPAPTDQAAPSGDDQEG